MAVGVCWRPGHGLPDRRRSQRRPAMRTQVAALGKRFAVSMSLETEELEDELDEDEETDDEEESDDDELDFDEDEESDDEEDYDEDEDER